MSEERPSFFRRLCRFDWLLIRIQLAQEGELSVRQVESLAQAEGVDPKAALGLIALQKATANLPDGEEPRKN